MASRRKRGPVAFRPRLSAGLALSLSSYKRMGTDSHQLQLPCPAEKPAFSNRKSIGLGYGAEMRQLSKVTDSAATLRVHNVVQTVTRFPARSLEG